jgi:hypothetical protein
MRAFYIMACLLLAAPAGAGTISLPKGCTAYLTVQQRSCRVAHHWTCAGEPAGNKWILSITEDGPAFLQQLDNEFRWLQSESLRSGTTRRLISGGPDDNSLTGLLETGRDSYDFSQRVVPRRGGAFDVRVTGVDTVSGKTVTIDGEELLVTAFNSRVRGESSGFDLETVGRQYVSKRWRLFFGGQETETIDGTEHSYDDTPVKFIEPGEPGFLTDKPQYGCEMMMSGLELPLAAEQEMNNGL